MKSSGMVYLVGAGPGDGGLLTLRGAELLAQAQVVVHDALAHPGLLRRVPADAECISVAKRAGHHAMPQDDINRLLVAKAREGRVVVRLKGGDPFVFGRGGEEALALVAAGVPFRVVPGITAGIGGLAYAGIPATHRDVNEAVTFVTGHNVSGEVPDGLNWAALAAGAPVLVFYMALKHLPQIRDRLIEAGRPADEPAAVVSHAATEKQRTLVTSLARLVEDAEAAKMEAAKMEPPAVVVVGPAVKLASGLDWLGAMGGRALDADPLNLKIRREAS